MSKPGFAMLQDVIMDEEFPDLDLALRRGRHVDREDAAWYTLLSDAQEQLEGFYRRYGCELIHKTDGYFYLLPTGDKLSRRQLAVGDMLVGQALALMYLDPAVMERAGTVTSEELIAQLSSVLGTDALIGAFNPKRKRFDERIAHKNVRKSVAEAVRHLAALGFVAVLEEDRLQLRAALMRFAEPVRAASEPAEALAKLVAQGEVAFVPVEGELAEAVAEAADDEQDEVIVDEHDDVAVDDEVAVDVAAAAESSEVPTSLERGAADGGEVAAEDDDGAIFDAAYSGGAEEETAEPPAPVPEVDDTDDFDWNDVVVPARKGPGSEDQE